MNDHPQNFKIVVDVGASIGEFASHVLLHDRTSKVFAVEPNIKYCESYLNKVKQNYFGRMNIFYYALSNKSGEFDFYGSQVLGGNIGSLKKLNPEKRWDPYLDKNLDRNVLAKNTIVKVKKVQDFLSENELTHIDFLKIDAQGSDIEILELFLKNVTVTCSVVEVNTSSNPEENIYLSNNDLNALLKIVCKYELHIIKIVPNSDFSELNVFLAKEAEEGLSLINDLKLKDSITFSRGWEVLVTNKNQRNDQISLVSILWKMIFGIKRPIKSLKAVLRRLAF